MKEFSRCNSTISTAAAALDAGAITQAEHDSFVAQARTLRGVYHFWAWKLWADRGSNTFVPYVDENTDQSVLTNTEDIRARIIEDLTSRDYPSSEYGSGRTF